MSRTRTAYICIIFFAICGCKDQPKKCKSNSDCNKGEVCEKTWHEGSGCTSNTSCNDDGSMCYSSQSCDSSGWVYVCAVVSCDTSAICAPTVTACRDGFCADAPCQDWTQCENGEACKGGSCTAAECTVSCAQPRACRQGICAVVPCADVGQCAAGEQCSNGNCMQ